MNKLWLGLLSIIILSGNAIAADGVFTNLRATNARFTNMSGANVRSHGTHTGTFAGTVSGAVTGNIIGNVTGIVNSNRINASLFANLSTAVSSTTTVGKTIEVSSAQTVNTLTIPTNRSIEVVYGGTITTNMSKTLTINGPFSAGYYPVFAGTGVVKFGKNLVKEVYPEWFGATIDTHSGASLVPFVQKACDSLPVDTVNPVLGGGRVIINPGFYLASAIKDVSIPDYVIIDDRGRADHANLYSGSTDVEYTFAGPTADTGSSSPTVRIHNQGVDGKRIPTLLFSAGRNETSYNSLLWSLQGGNDYNVAANVAAHDLVLAGGQGSSITVGTAAVNSASATVTGTGTNWTGDLVGAILTIDAQAAASGIVKSVEDTTHLTLENTWGTYGGVTAVAGAYHLEGGFWAGTQTTDYRARLVLGQNYTWLFNTGNYSNGDSSPLAVGNGGGSYPANISYVMNGNRLKGGTINPSTLVKLDNGSGTGGYVGHIYASSDYSGSPSKFFGLDKSSNTLQVKNSIAANPHIIIGSNGIQSNATATVYADQTFAASFTPDLTLGSTIGIVLTDNITIGAPDSGVVTIGQEITFYLRQGAAGGKTVTFGASYQKAGGAYTMSAGAFAKDTITFIAVAGNYFIEKSRAQGLN